METDRIVRAADESDPFDNDPPNFAIWGEKRVSVWDFTYATWRPHVAAMAIPSVCPESLGSATFHT